MSIEELCYGSAIELRTGLPTAIVGVHLRMAPAVGLAKASLRFAGLRPHYGSRDLSRDNSRDIIIIFSFPPRISSFDFYLLELLIKLLL